MRRRLWLLVATILLTGLPALAEEAGEAHGGGAEGLSAWTAPIWGVPMIAWQVANILLVVGLFWYLLRRPAPQFFEGRAKEIQDLLEKAIREKEDATARLKEVEAKMERLKDEVAGIEASALQQAEADKLRVQADAEQARQRIRQEAKDEIDRRMIDARRELKRYAADTAVAMAREALSRGITESDESRLKEKFLVGVGEEAAHERGR
jgi:F0F1-type ATP synthase membrane subunit b/b'